MKKSIKNILLSVLVMLSTGCSFNELTAPKKAKIDNNIPTVAQDSIRFIPGVTSVAFEWKGSYGENIVGYHLYRSIVKNTNQKLIRVATINNKYASHYVDTKLKPQTNYIYTFSTAAKNGTESRTSNSIKIMTLPLIESISLINAIDGLPRQVKLVWRPHSNLSVNSYIIQRSELKNSKWKNIETIKHRLNAEFIDLDLKDNTDYLYRIISVNYEGIKSKPSQTVQATTKKLPVAPSGTTASQDIAQRIVLNWEAINDENNDIIAYNIYSSSSKDGYYSKIASTSAQVSSYEDVVNDNGKVKYYKITSIDKDQLESRLKDIKFTSGKSLVIPFTPTVTLGQINNDTVILNWIAADSREVSYNVHKTFNTNFFSKKVRIFKNVQGLRFEDTDIKRGVSYTYEIQSIDKYGLKSEKTTPVKLKLSQE